MLRNLLDGLALFLLPFAVYGGAVLLRERLRTGPLAPQWTSGRLALLALCGLGLVAVGLVLFGLLLPQREGAYVPAHMDDGRLVPGRIQ